MKTLYPKAILVILIIIYNTLFSQNKIPDDFKKIPDSLFFKDRIYKYIHPSQKYKYWKVINKEGNSETTIYEWGNKRKSNSASKGFFYECEPIGCFSYIVAIKKGKPEYFTNENQLRDFIGEIDNLSEALLIAKTYEFWYDKKDLYGGAYRFDNDYYYLYLAKFENCPITKESFFVKINRKTNKIEYQSNGIYYKTKDCYTS